MVLMMIAPLSDLKCFLTDGFPIAELRVTDQPVPIPVLIIGDEDYHDGDDDHDDRDDHDHDHDDQLISPSRSRS